MSKIANEKLPLFTLSGNLGESLKELKFDGLQHVQLPSFMYSLYTGASSKYKRIVASLLRNLSFSEIPSKVLKWPLELS